MKMMLAAAAAIALTFFTASTSQATTWGNEHDAYVEQIIESALEHEHPAWSIEEAAYIEELVSAAYAPDTSKQGCLGLSSNEGVRIDTRYVVEASSSFLGHRLVVLVDGGVDGRILAVVTEPLQVGMHFVRKNAYEGPFSNIVMTTEVREPPDTKM